jgi:hypothetical protein
VAEVGLRVPASSPLSTGTKPIWDSSSTERDHHPFASMHCMKALRSEVVLLHVLSAWRNSSPPAPCLKETLLQALSAPATRQ